MKFNEKIVRWIIHFFKRFDIDSNQWLNHDKFNGDMNLMLPTEDEYLSIIRKEYSDLQVPFIANSKRLGDI